MAKQQLNVTISPDLIRAAKHNAVDTQRSLSALVAHAIEAHLNPTKGARMPDEQPAVALQPMVHVENLGAAIDFFESLGAFVRHGSRDGDFAMLGIGSAQLSLLAHPPNPEQDEGRVELNFETTEPLEDLERRLGAEGVEIAQPTTDEAFGRQLQVRSPDGLLIKINELDTELYS
jgi:hypothetical protein